MNTVLEDTARYYMWCRYIPCYRSMTKNQKKHSRYTFACNNESLPSDFNPIEEDYSMAERYPINSLCSSGSGTVTYTPGSTASISGAALKKGVKISPWAVSNNSQMMDLVCTFKGAEAKEEKETTMAYPYDTQNLETSQRNHLSRRLTEAEQAQKKAMRVKYNIDFDASPKTKDEIQRKLLAGEFELDAGSFDGEGKLLYYVSAAPAIRWFDPARKEDRPGYDAAKASLAKAFTAAKDAVIVKSLDDGLKALQDFEAMTF